MDPERHQTLDLLHMRKPTEKYITSNAKIQTAWGIEKMHVEAREEGTFESFNG